jgi:NADPH:quinone reductase-like Zn-dependent oxidoreductase
MKAWQLEGLGGKLTFEDVPVPEIRPGSVLVRMIAVGRNESALEAVAKAGGVRVIPLQLTGDIATDAAAIRKVGGAPADMAFDIGQPSE